MCVSPALSGVELEEDAEAVPQSGVVLSDGVVPQQHQTGEHLSAGDSAGVHQFSQTLGCLCAQVRHLKERNTDDSAVKKKLYLYLLLIK